MSYGGLATGAGAAKGLEELFARMRAEEQLANQGRQIDIDDFNSRSADSINRAKIAEETRQFDANGPLRQAQVGSLDAGAAENNANAGILGERAGILRGLRTMTEAEASAGLAGGPNPGVVPNGSAGVGQMNNPLGRLRLSMGGVAPGEVFGAVRQNDNTDDDLDAYAVKIHGAGSDRNSLSYDDRMRALAGRPQTVIAQGGLDLRKKESGQRQAMYDLRIKLAESQLNQIPVFQRELATAEFRNRITNDIKSQTWTQWFMGEEVPDPSAQIETIAADVMTKYGAQNGPNAGGSGNTGNTAPGGAAPGAGDDIDAILRSRKGAGPVQ